jgi:hypothetical protein
MTSSEGQRHKESATVHNNGVSNLWRKREARDTLSQVTDNFETR